MRVLCYTIVGDSMNNKFVDLIKSKVNSGELKTKEDILNYIRKIRESAYSSPELMNLLKEAGINLDEQDLNKVTTAVLDYYDRTKEDTTSLNLDGVSQMVIKDEKGFDDKYIKIENKDGSYTVLEDNMNNKDFVTQFNERQNKSVNLQSNDGVKNKEEIVKEMRKDKLEANLESTNSINTRELTPEERREFAAVMKGRKADEINFIVDTKRNIYIDKDTGETYYTYLNNDNKMEVRKVNETTSETISDDVNSIDEKGMETQVMVEAPQDVDMNNLDDYELQYMLDNKFNSLTLEQKQTLLAIIERRKEMKSNENTRDLNNEKGYQYTLKFNDPKKQNGYLNLIFLSLVTLLFGIGFILFIVLS